jgi:hypothetical protein
MAGTAAAPSAVVIVVSAGGGQQRGRDHAAEQEPGPVLTSVVKAMPHLHGFLISMGFLSSVSTYST